MLKEIDTYDWENAFTFSTIDRERVIKIEAMAEGYNDGDSWVGVFLLDDGTYLALTAGCDYTGWDCQACGEGKIFSTKAEAMKWHTLDDIVRMRKDLHVLL